MDHVRVIPCLLLRRRGLVKTIKFREPRYVGDPINSVKIFNDKQADELAFLDIGATTDGSGPDFELIADIAAEAFMPFAYGGGITSVEQAERLIDIGVEKVIINTAAVRDPELVPRLVEVAGSQSVVVAIDVHRSIFGRSEVMLANGAQSTGIDPVVHACRAEAMGAGEILLTSVDRDGTMSGYDLRLVRMVTQAVAVPVIASGGAGSLEDLRAAVKEGGCSAVAAGSMFTFHGKHRAVLITYPRYETLRALFS